MKTHKKIQENMHAEKKRKKREHYIWVGKLTILAFAISVSFSFVSEIALKNASLWLSTFIVFLFIIIGVVFDMVGMAVATAEETPFHAMSSRKIKSARIAIKLKRNANKVSSFCQDVIGDICGIISGSAGVVIASSLAEMFDLPIFISTLLVTGTIAALTIGGKAFEKTIAMEKSNAILHQFAKIMSLFYVGK